MATEAQVKVHALTVNSDGTPKYTASDYRKANNAFFPPAVGDYGFACVQGVRATYNGPICGISGLNVHIRDHSGFLYPFRGESPYTYYVPDTYIQVPNVTQDWKLVVVVTDSTVGHGTTQSAKLTTVPYSTPNNKIDGLVLAVIVKGVISEVAPRFLSGTIIQTANLDQLKAITTVDGQRAIVTSTQDDYIRQGGTWVKQEQFVYSTGQVTYTESPSKLKIDRLEKWGHVVHMTGNINDGNAAPNAFTYGNVPVGFRPTGVVHLTQGEAGGINGAVGDTGVIRFQSPKPFGCWIDACWITK